MVHVQRRTLTCDTCKRNFRSAATYQAHQRRDHGWKGDDVKEAEPTVREGEAVGRAGEVMGRAGEVWGEQGRRWGEQGRRCMKGTRVDRSGCVDIASQTGLS